MSATLYEVYLFAFFIGLTGALAPGPTLVATITASLKGGWSTGPKVAAGHILIEILLAGLIVIGLGTAVPAGTGAETGLIAVVGGAALVVFGLLTLRDARGATLAFPKQGFVTNPYLAGAFTSVANPYFWIWWFSVGSILLFDILPGGMLMAVVFMAGHFTADLGWLTVVAAGIHHGRTILSPRQYRAILGACGLFLIIIGISYPLSRLVT
jgi:threonine/homoserine/homoserine lactone efflux protein